MTHVTARHAAHLPRSRQRGVALFVALIGMVILMLAGIAIVHTVDSATGVAGNLAFRQASIAPVNEAIEQSVDALFKSKTIPTLTATDAAHGYFPFLQAGEKTNAVPAALSGPYVTMAANWTAAGLPKYVDPLSSLEVRWMIERVCNPDVMAGGGGATYQYCDMQPPKVSQAGTDNKPGLSLPPIPNFRVSVRVDLPNTNAVSYAQAFLR